MKRKMTIFGVVMSLTIGCIACQPNPEEEFVAGKNEGKLESAIAETAQTEVEEESSTAVEEVRTYQDSYQGGDDRVQIEIDAEIMDFHAGTPVLRVRPHEITPEEVKKWADVLLEGAIAYEPVSAKTKSEIMNEILEIKAILSNEDRIWANASSQEDFDYLKEYWEEQLAFYEKQYEAAPEDMERKETDWEFLPGSYYDEKVELHEGDVEYENEVNKLKELRIEATVDGATVSLSAANRSEEDYHIHNLWYIAPDELYATGRLRETKEEAIQIAEDVLERVGLSDWKLYSYNYKEIEGHGTVFHSLKFVREYEGIELAPLPQLSAIGTDEQYASACYYESLELRVSNGKVRYVSWMQPMEVIAVENPHVEILSWDDAMGKAKNLMQSIYTSGNVPYAWSSEAAFLSGNCIMKITRIEGGLARIQVPNEFYEFYLVPTWFFYGTVNNQSTSFTEIGYGEFVIEKPLLIMNAVDGSNINVELGY